MIHEYRAFARDRAISYEAIGVLSALVLPKFDLTGATVDQLAALCSDPPEAVWAPLAELVAAKYVSRHVEHGRTVWRATDKAYRTATERVA